MPGKVIEITDYSSSELDIFARLTEPQLRNYFEVGNGVFVAESPKVIRLALSAGYSPVALLMGRRHLAGQGAEFITACGDVPVYTADEEVLENLTGYRLTRGILCAFRRRELPSVEQVCKTAERIAVLENITDATNLGAIVRSAAALGVDALLMTPSCCDPLNRRAVRVSMGTIFQIPWTYIGAEPVDWPEKGLSRLQALGFKTAAMALSDDSVSVDDKNLANEKKIAVILGTEGDGLSERTVAACDYTVKIPMFHGVDSLNVAAASAVAFWQLRKK